MCARLGLVSLPLAQNEGDERRRDGRKGGSESVAGEAPIDTMYRPPHVQDHVYGHRKWFALVSTIPV